MLWRRVLDIKCVILTRPRLQGHGKCTELSHGRPSLRGLQIENRHIIIRYLEALPESAWISEMRGVARCTVTHCFFFLFITNPKFPISGPAASVGEARYYRHIPSASDRKWRRRESFEKASGRKKGRRWLRADGGGRVTSGRKGL